MQGEHFAFVLSLDSNNSYRDHKCYCACYKLLDKGIHDLGVSDNFLKTGNCFRKLVCVCMSGDVIKIRKSRFYCFLFLEISRERFFGLMADIRSTSFWRVKSMQKVFLLPVSY